MLFFYVFREWMTNICVKRFSAVVKNICNAVAPLAAYVLQFAILQTKTFQLAKMYASNLKFLIFKTNLARVFPFRFKFFIMFLNYLIIFVNFVDKKTASLSSWSFWKSRTTRSPRVTFPRRVSQQKMLCRLRSPRDRPARSKRETKRTVNHR